MKTKSDSKNELRKRDARAKAKALKAGFPLTVASESSNVGKLWAALRCGKLRVWESELLPLLPTSKDPGQIVQDLRTIGKKHGFLVQRNAEYQGFQVVAA